MRHLLGQRSFRVLLVGSAVDQIGSQMALIATVFWLRQRSDAAALLGLSATIAALPMLLLSPLGGVCADRWSRRKILIASHILSCLTCLALTGLSSGSGLNSTVVFAGLFAGVFIISACTAFAHPAMTAFLADVVAPQQLNSAMGMMQTLSLPAMIGGQALGALLLDRVPLPVLFGIDGATYVVYAAALAFTIPVAAAAPTPTLQESDRRLRPHLGARLYADLRAAADYIWHRPGMRFILLAAIPVSILTETLLVFLPVYATNALQVVLSHYPYLTASYSVGLLAGYSAVAREIIPSVRRSSIVTGCILASAAICMGLALTRSYWTALPLLLLFGVCTGSIFLLSLNALLAQTDPDMRGRVSAVLLMITQGLTPLAMSGLGIAVDQLAGNVRPVYGACSLAFGLLGLLFACSRMLQYFFSRPRSRPT